MALLQEVDTKYEIHPVVILSILDHFTRRTNGDRVIGTLLGEQKEGLVEIKNSYPVPHKEEDEDIGVNIEFHKSMLELHRTVYPNDVVVGWYATGKEITDNDLVIHELYSELKPNPIFVVVDASAEIYNQPKMPVKAYMSRSLRFKDDIIGSHFIEIDVVYKISENEKIGVNTMLNVQKDLLMNTSSTGSDIFNELEQLETSMTQLEELLANLSQYVDDVVKGVVKGDTKIGKFLSDALSSLPRLNHEQFDREFNGQLQDLLMVCYLSNMLQAQLNIAQKLSNI